MIKYEFSVLRYIYDSLTQEFINVGVVVYSPSAGFLQARLNPNYGRASKIFGSIDGTRFRAVLRHLQAELDRLAADFSKGLLFDLTIGLEKFLSQILPIDDSSLQFSMGGAGVTDNLSRVSEKLFLRYVNAHENAVGEGRTEEDVWKIFRAPLERRALTDRLIPKRIAGKDYGYEFQHAWKNGVWNLYEPISFDLLEEHSIVEKANKWLGRSYSLRDSSEEFKLSFLLGAPRDERLMNAFRHAENILNKMHVKKEFVREDQAEDFAEQFECLLKTVA